MIFTIFGYICSSILIALLTAWRFTKDIYPYGLKKFLTRLVLQNWTNHQPVVLSQYDALHAKCTSDIGIVATEDETRLEKPVALQCINDSDQMTFYGIDERGNGIVAKITRFYNDLVECTVCLILNGRQYSVSRSATVPSSCQEFSMGNLKFEMVEPMKTWRIWYNGMLSEDGGNELSESEVDDTSSSNYVHAVINLFWKPLDAPFDCRKDVNIDLLSDYLSKTGHFGVNFTDLASKILPNGYTQFGVHNGMIKIDGIENTTSLYGFRQRHLSPATSPWSSFQTKNSISPTQKSGPTFSEQQAQDFQIEFFGMCDCNGNAFRLTGLNNGWTDGHILYPSFEKNPILSIDVEPSEFVTKNCSNTTQPKLFVLQDKSRSFRIEIWPKSQIQRLGNLEIILLQLNVNGKDGCGFLMRTTTTRCSFINLDLIMNSLDTKAVNVDQHSLRGIHVVPFDSSECRNVGLVGGKAASLARLSSISKNDHQKFGTANGFCVTTSLFSSVLDQARLKILFATSDNLEQACLDVIELVKASNAKDLIVPHVTTMLYKIFDDTKIDKLRFAVRSSGTLEDMLELSAAGQNETFLNVTFEMIPKKIVDCWASLFTFQSVQYRLNHGQPVWSEMGVVVQEMIDAKSAGVLFTADPRTGNPFELIINANFGLGESVVSGACEPDTIILKRSNQHPMSMSIKEKQLGSKSIRIVSAENGLTRTVAVAADLNDGQSFSISDDLALRLGEIGLEIEKQLGNWKPIDIEWAIDQHDNIIILQSRSMTSLDTWNDSEIIHEMDTATRTNFERLTTANTGEVMPGATSQLSLSTMTRFLDASICCRLATFNSDRIIPYISRSTNISRQRLLLNMINMLYRSIDNEIGPPLAALELTMFGHRLDTEEYRVLGAERFGVQSTFKKLAFLPQAAYCVWESFKTIKDVAAKYDNYSTKLDLATMDDSKVVYEKLTEKLFDLLHIGIEHCTTSQVSSVTNMFAFLTLASGQKVDEWDTPLYEDISKMLTVGIDVESADIPNAINQLASTIVNHGDSVFTEKFVNSSPSEALELLKSMAPLNEALDAFFKKHGHRCYAELDLMRQSWKTEPLPFISLVQSIVNNKLEYPNSTSWSTGSKYSNDDTLLDSLNTKITSGSRRFLKFILKYCNRAVQNREKTKSLLVRTAVQMKMVYNHLGNLLVKERLISNPRLIYFMTHYEIGLVVQRDNSISRILFKAMKRFKLYPELNKEYCPEVVIGKFEPIEDTNGSNLELGESIKATPLSSGKVQATVKVCFTVEEASQILKPGDILITRATDIAWSPFFPMLGGIVTELGGLMSHGAVVAREYGLPCIVGAIHATKIFKTGEKVILDAGNGTLTKVKSLN